MMKKFLGNEYNQGDLVLTGVAATMMVPKRRRSSRTECGS